MQTGRERRKRGEQGRQRREREKRGRKKGEEEGKRKVGEGGDGFGRIGRELGDDREKEGCWYDIFYLPLNILSCAGVWAKFGL